MSVRCNEPNDAGSKNAKRLALASVILIACLLTAVFAAFGGTSEAEPDTGAGEPMVTSGTCGEHATWNFEITDTTEGMGTLAISGTGAMEDYDGYHGKYSPWYPLWEKITAIDIAEGITYIGDYAFYDCMKVPTLTIPSSVTKIGNHSFDTCRIIEPLIIPDTVREVGRGAFALCNKTASLSMPADLVFAFDSFEQMYGLTSITITKGETGIFFLDCNE